MISIILFDYFDNIPTIHQVKTNITLMYEHEELKFKLKDEEDIMEKDGE